ncbi:hypothetical protein CWI83_06060 [Pseudidiomarina taiwanensis]|uniref:Uncharacterized protein n=1 Tax=Pseudidiomarina taiwanensis TaxID=337250 RepID=A0A432ZL12_9GAMM|nr:hypothetical protein CWI83_06060 [Pseudidiomarina taiwanensis]
MFSDARKLLIFNHLSVGDSQLWLGIRASGYNKRHTRGRQSDCESMLLLLLRTKKIKQKQSSAAIYRYYFQFY